MNSLFQGQATHKAFVRNKKKQWNIGDVYYLALLHKDAPLEIIQRAQLGV